MKVDLTIAEIKTIKEDVESRIEAILNIFHEDTGLIIERIEVGTIEEIEDGNKFYTSKLKSYIDINI